MSKLRFYNRFILFAVLVLALLAFVIPTTTSAKDRPYTAGEKQEVSRNHEQVDHSSHSSEHITIGTKLPLTSCIPFAGILLSIALFPMLAPGFWHRNFPKISLSWALLLMVPFLIVFKAEALYQILHIYLADYIPFIILLWGLFTVSGGIYLKGSLVGRPIVNLVILIIGAILASWMGTTGAAMLLIRPLIRANRGRKYKIHTVIFFIFLVANIGGSLTPLGDPPLFLGFLHGVPFFWTFSILKHMLLTAAILLVLYFVIDTILYRREQPSSEQQPEQHEKFSIHGAHNFLLLMGIMGAVFMSGTWDIGKYHVYGVHMTYQSTLRDLLIILMGLLSLKTTKWEHRKANGFTWFPILEVAYLFAGIFATIIPPLLILKAGLEGSAAPLIKIVNHPYHYFWMTGTLSAFLDNAPTYLTFFNLSLGKLSLVESQVTPILTGVLNNAQAADFIKNLKAISAGAVFFGAVTYIGNAPNFMVRSIAEESRIKMPSFFGYMLWSVGILVPVFLLVTYVFF